MRTLTIALFVSLLAAASAGAAVVAPRGPDDANEPSAVHHAHRDTIPYVIVTTRELRSEFTRLARAHTRDGLRAQVWTLEAIRYAYPGARDDAERIREFLQDAWRFHGARWLLLGGSHRVIPMRHAFIDIPGLTIDMPTDQYYACLDGDWNADGDSLWGEERVDAPDLLPELIVGRAPVNTRREAERFVDRTLDALLDGCHDRRHGHGHGHGEPHADDGASVLLLASILGNGLIDLAKMAETLRPIYEGIPSNHVTRLYESAPDWPGSWPLTRESAIDALNRGYDFNVLLGAGASGVFAVHDKPGPQVALTTTDFGALVNRHRGLFYFVSANTCEASDAPSIGEALVNAPRGGATAVVGPSAVQFVSFANHVAAAFLASSAPTIGEALFQVQSDMPSVIRTSTQGLVLLGDPALPFDIPRVEQDAPHMIAMAPGGEIALSTGSVPPATSSSPVSHPAMPADMQGARASASPTELSLSLQSPSPARTSMRVRLAIPPSLAGGPIEIAAYDAGGRRVRAIERGVARAGFHDANWNLEDDAGAPVGAGVYFIGARVGSRMIPQRVVVIR